MAGSKCNMNDCNLVDDWILRFIPMTHAVS